MRPTKWVLLQVKEDSDMGVPLQIPIEVARGHFEKLTSEELHELAADIGAEIRRRAGVS